MSFVYLKWFFLELSEKLVDIINYIFAPIIVLFADDNGWLPWYLDWFQTPDNSLDGDIPWQLERRPFKKNYGIYQYLNRVFWLYRNSSYGYANKVVGIKKNDEYLLLNNFFSEESAKPSDYDIIGGKMLKWILLFDGEPIAFQFYKIHVWGKTNHCFRLNIGWKLWDWNNPNWTHCNIVFSIHPWKKIDRGLENN